MDQKSGDSVVNTRPSHLFYVTRLRRPLVDRAEGIYLWTQDGRRFIDGSSGPVAVNLGYGNRHVLDAMQRQMEKTTFAYRLHFENEPAEELARDHCRPDARRAGKNLLRVGRLGSGGILHQAGAAMGGGDRPAEALEGDQPHAVLSWRHLWRALGHRRRGADRQFFATSCA